MKGREQRMKQKHGGSHPLNSKTREYTDRNSTKYITYGGYSRKRRKNGRPSVKSNQKQLLQNHNNTYRNTPQHNACHGDDVTDFRLQPAPYKMDFTPSWQASTAVTHYKQTHIHTKVFPIYIENKRGIDSILKDDLNTT
mmetsp:Transcript_7314/g.10741  ORF Transcript_7314/g.10741 Transcript_7314/m.10741 type:complete len:139 (+) Transcript_7314:668-1084(+)